MKEYKLPQGIPTDPLYEDILVQPHTLIAGATGSGKSVVLNGIIKTILARSMPQDAFLVLIDPKKVELQYDGVPHVQFHAINHPEIIHALEWCDLTMDNRYTIMQGCRAKKWTGAHIYIIIDEYADICDNREIVSIIKRIAALGRAAGIHLIIATQRCTRDIINGLIKTNIDSRLALRVPTAQDSRNLINVSGAEQLPRYGQGLYLTPETMPPCLVDIPYTDDKELDDLYYFWRRQAQ